MRLDQMTKEQEKEFLTWVEQELHRQINDDSSFPQFPNSVVISFLSSDMGFTIRNGIEVRDFFIDSKVGRKMQRLTKKILNQHGMKLGTGGEIVLKDQTTRGVFE